MTETLGANSMISHYRIVSKIGVGGMGEVYLAQDTKLDRQIALKVLLDEVAGDEERVKRFVQEAKAASALNHPNILTVYEIGEFEQARYIATELIKGETLRDRLRGEPMTLREILDVAMQVAAALNAAHSAGIVHRDIKPENIMLRDDRIVKVLDFGLAKLAADPNATAESEDATRAQVNTRPGVVMGTVQYMSPEQARGKETDARCDIWSLGIVMFEMLTKRTPFAGETANDSIAAILTKDPPPLDASTPSELQRIIRKTLQKNADERYQTVKDLLLDVKNLKRELEISDELERSQVPHATGSANVGTAQFSEHATAVHSGVISTQNSMPQQRSSAEYIVSEIKSHKLVVVGGVIFLLVAIGAVFGIYKYSGFNGSAKKEFSLADATVTKLTTNGKATFSAISPDGKYVAHIQQDGVQTSIYLRQVATQSNVQIVPPDELGFISQVFFSRDGNYVYYNRAGADDPLLSTYRVPTLGGQSKKVLNDVFRLVAFSPDGGRLAFSRKVNNSFQLLTANADGSNEEKVLDTNPKEGLDNIVWSPDGKKIIYEIFKFELWENKDSGTTTLFEIQLADRSTRRFSGKDWAHILALSWSPDGSTLLMLASEKKEPPQIWQVSYPEGTAKRLTNDPDGYVAMSASADLGTMAVVKSSATSSLWVAPASDPGLVRPITSGSDKSDVWPSWSPNGRIFFFSASLVKGDIWSVNVDGSGLRQITSTPEFEQTPIVSPDGRYIAYNVYSGSLQAWLINSDGSSPRQIANGGAVGDWAIQEFSPDGRWLYYTEIKNNNNFTLWKIAVDGSGEAIKVSDKNISGILISPDGKQMAYFNVDAKPPRLEIAPLEVFEPVKSFVPCPTCGFGRWSPDGRSFVYIDTSKDGVSNLWTQPISGGQPKKLTTFTSEQIYSFAFSLDGKQIALSRGTQTSDVLLYTNIK